VDCASASVDEVPRGSRCGNFPGGHEAAAAAGLSRVLFAAESDGLRLTTTAEGGMAAVSPAGQTVFSAPAPQMWDATAGESGNEAGGRRTPMQLQINGTRLTVLPDQRMLTDPGVRYPLYIDRQ
jgi:hypothetical protein